jgi:uncharacterized protein (TIGR01370 family)
MDLLDAKRGGVAAWLLGLLLGSWLLLAWPLGAVHAAGLAPVAAAGAAPAGPVAPARAPKNDGAAAERSVPAMALSQVRSWLYKTQMPCPGGGNCNCLFQDLPGLAAQSFVPDLVVVPLMGCVDGNLQPRADIRRYQDAAPDGRLVLGFIGFAEVGRGNWLIGSAAQWEAWYPPGAFVPRPGAPDWMASANRSWPQPGLFSTRYWLPSFWDVTRPQLDLIIDQGFDGVFLDSGDAYWWWSGPTRYPDNEELTRADAIDRLAEVVLKVRRHLDSRVWWRRMPLFINGGLEMFRQRPDVLAALDGFLNEGGYHVHLRQELETPQAQASIQQWSAEAIRRGKLVLSTAYTTTGFSASYWWHVPGYFQWAVDGGFLPVATDLFHVQMQGTPRMTCTAVDCSMAAHAEGGIAARTLARPPSPRSLTGWWWDPAKPGEGWAVEWTDGKLFAAWFGYDAQGTARWAVTTGAVAADGRRYDGEMRVAANGATLAQPPRTSAAYTGTLGPVTMEVLGPTAMRVVAFGRTMNLRRFEIDGGDSGVRSGPRPGSPETGWYVEPDNPGRGYFIEVQDARVFVGAFMYRDDGSAVWYVDWSDVAARRNFGQTIYEYRQSGLLGSPGGWKFAFGDPFGGEVTLPSGRKARLLRFTF